MIRHTLWGLVGVVLLVLVAVPAAGAPADTASAETAGQTTSDDLRAIADGTSRQGQIDRGDPQSSEYRGYYEPVTFQGSADDRVSIRMSSSGDTYLFLVGPHGEVIAENDDNGAGDLNSQIETTLPAGGEYTIIATSYDSSATFDYTLSLDVTEERSVAQADVASISDGQTVSSSLDRGDPQSSEYRGYYEPVTFQGSADDRVSIRMSSPGDTYLFLVGPDGEVIAENDDNGAGDLNSQIETTLPTDGEYTIIATSYDSDATFGYDLSLQQVDLTADASDVRSITYGSLVQSDLEPSDPESLDYRGNFEPLSFRGYADETITVEMSSSGDTYLFLVGPDREVIAENDDNGAGDLNSQIETTLPTDGEYTIIATSYDSSATFDYTLSLTAENLDPARETTEEPNEAEDEDEDEGGSGTGSSGLGPGFGVPAAVVALLSLAVVLRRT